MSVERRRQMIEPGHPQLSIVRQCELVSISRSGFYYRPAGETPLNLALMRLIDAQFLQTPWYGSRQMARHLRREGYTVGRKRVRRLMAKMGLAPIYQRPRTTVPHPEHRVYPYLLRDLMIDRPNQVWCSDITYIPMRRGFLYLVAIMDWASRKVLSWRVSNTMDVEFCLEALERPWRGSASRISSTATRVANSPRHGSPACCKLPGSASPWTAADAGWIMCSLSGCGAA
jgi:putative transposase